MQVRKTDVKTNMMIKKQQIAIIYTSSATKFCNMYTSQEGSYLIHACPFSSANEYNCLSDTVTGRC